MKMNIDSITRSLFQVQPVEYDQKFLNPQSNNFLSSGSHLGSHSGSRKEEYQGGRFQGVPDKGIAFQGIPFNRGNPVQEEYQGSSNVSFNKEDIFRGDKKFSEVEKPPSYQPLFSVLLQPVTLLSCPVTISIDGRYQFVSIEGMRYRLFKSPEIGLTYLLPLSGGNHFVNYEEIYRQLNTLPRPIYAYFSEK